jgi:hypothetical protein
MCPEFLPHFILRVPLSAAASAGLGFYPETTAGIGKIFFEKRLMYIRNPLISSIWNPQI